MMMAEIEMMKKMIAKQTWAIVDGLNTELDISGYNGIGRGKKSARDDLHQTNQYY